MFSQYLKLERSKAGMKLRELSAATGIDQTLISRFERGDRLPTEDQIGKLTKALNVVEDEAKVEWLADRVTQILRYSHLAPQVLMVLEDRVEYLQKGIIEEIEVSEEIQQKLDVIDALKEKWEQAHPLNKTQLERLQEYFDTEYTYESNRIEGNTLTLQETSLVVNQGLTIGGKSMREHLEAINHAHAIDFVRTLVRKHESLSSRNLLEIHRLILKEIDKENAGQYRQVPVRISGSKHVPPQPYALAKLMEDFFRQYRINESRLHPVILAAEMHERLVSIHPFIDGNGRTARLLMNLVLTSNGYTRANIKGDTSSRLAYYQALEAVQIDNNPEPFYHLVIDEVKRSLVEHLELV